MTEQVISALRRRMIEDMTIRRLAAKTQHDYVQRVKDFAAFLGRSPDTASFDDVRRFQLHLASSGAGTPKINATVSALRFFFNVTLGRADLAKPLATLRQERKAPVILSPECRRTADQSLSVLRRAHDHRRKVRTRLDPTLSTDKSNRRYQNRYLMTTPKPQANAFARSLACASAGSDRLRSNTHSTAQKRQPLVAFVLTNPAVVSPSNAYPGQRTADRQAVA